MSSSPAPAAPAPERKAPTVLLWVLMAAMAAGPIFNYGLGALSATIVDTYGISEGQYGFIITVVFVSAGVTASFLGLLADRMDTRLQLAIIFAGALLAFLISATWQVYTVLIIAALVVGPTQAFSNPVTNRIVAERVPLAQRSRWMGWKQSGVQMGLLVSGLTFPLVGAGFGWRGAALYGAALSGVGLVLGWVVITRLRRRAAARDSDLTSSTSEGPNYPTPADEPATSQPPHASDSSEAVPAEGEGAASSSSEGAHGKKPKLPKAVWLFAAASLLNAVGTQGVNVYASLFAVRAMGYTLTVAGLLMGVIGVVGILSRIYWGRLNGRVGRPAPLLMIMSAGGIAGLACLMVAEATQLHWLMWAGVALHAALPLAANVVINSGIVAVVPQDRVGVASGLVATGMYLGFASGPAVVGQLVDLTGAFTAGWVGVAVTYVLCFGVGLILLRVQPRRTA